MSLMFGFSTDAGSSRHTSRIIGPILRWFNPNISNETVEAIQHVARKGAHLTEYAILATLVWRAVRRPLRGDGRSWSRREALIAIGVAALFAASDEWHQSTIPSRQGQFSDVVLDTAGATVGMILVWAAGRCFKRW
jgi:VanZ family protein